MWFKTKKISKEAKEYIERVENQNLEMDYEIAKKDEQIQALLEIIRKLYRNGII